MADNVTPNQMTAEQREAELRLLYGDPSRAAELTGLQNIVNETRALQADYRNHLYFWNGGVAPPEPTRLQRVRRRLQVKTMNVRTGIARRIAPWLDEY